MSDPPGKRSWPWGDKAERLRREEHSRRDARRFVCTHVIAVAIALAFVVGAAILVETCAGRA